MSTNHKNKKGSFKVCPECGSRMESVEIKNTKDGVIYSKKILECIECGCVESRKDKKGRISLKDWNIEA
jgi:hypothetical protein